MLTDHGSTTDPTRLPRRRLIQAVFLVLALIPTVSSMLTIAVGVDRFADSTAIEPALDNTYRYLGGVYLAVALLALWSIARIEERIEYLVFVAAAIALGGVGRLVSVADVGAPSGLTWYVLIIEFGAVFFATAVRRAVRRLGVHERYVFARR